MNFSDVKKWYLTDTTNEVMEVVDSNGNLIWQKPQNTVYFWIENLSDNPNTVTFKQLTTNTPQFYVYYSLDGSSNWYSVGNISTTGISTTISPHSRKYFRAKTDAWGNNSNNYGNYIQCSEQFKVGGNIMSLLYGNTFNGQTEFPSGSFRNFAGLFHNNTNLVSASNLLLPATTANSSCFAYMFKGCTSLTTAPALPATTLASNCYSYMFQSCNSLTTAPALPATTLAGLCYEAMFTGCTGLTETPILPATTLTNYCYYLMFSACTNINKVTTYADNISATNCLGNWLYGVSSTGDFYNLGGATYPTDSASGIPTGWTEHTSL